MTVTIKLLRGPRAFPLLGRIFLFETGIGGSFDRLKYTMIPHTCDSGRWTGQEQERGLPLRLI
jgi:hypothetical protein